MPMATLFIVSNANGDIVSNTNVCEAVSNANVGDMESNPDTDFRNGMVSSQMSLTLQVMQM